MGSNSNGRFNRIASRDFHEEHITAENYIARDFINIATPTIEKDTRPLVPAQRKQLHQLILTVAKAGNEEGYEVWQRVHAEIGVKNVDEITVSQYQPALSYLQAQMDFYREQSQKNELVSALLKISANNDSYQKLLDYCRKKFGSSRLKTLKRTELQQALLWLDEERAEVINDVTNTKTTIRWWRLVLSYPVFTCAIFLIGIAIPVMIYFIFMAN